MDFIPHPKSVMLASDVFSDLVRERGLANTVNTYIPRARNKLNSIDQEITSLASVMDQSEVADYAIIISETKKNLDEIERLNSGHILTPNHAIGTLAYVDMTMRLMERNLTPLKSKMEMDKAR